MNALRIAPQYNITWAQVEAQEAQVTGQVASIPAPITVGALEVIHVEARETDRALKQILEMLEV